MNVYPSQSFSWTSLKRLELTAGFLTLMVELQHGAGCCVWSEDHVLTVVQPFRFSFGLNPALFWQQRSETLNHSFHFSKREVPSSPHLGFSPAPGDNVIEYKAPEAGSSACQHRLQVRGREKVKWNSVPKTPTNTRSSSWKSHRTGGITKTKLSISFLVELFFDITSNANV